MVKAFPFTAVSTYANRGQRAEYDASLALTGTGKKPDREKGTEKPDFYYAGYGIQCKSARATVCIDMDYFDYILTECACDKFLYVSYKTMKLYLMDKDDFLEFVDFFHCIDIDCYTGREKIRLSKETRLMLQWLTENTTK